MARGNINTVPIKANLYAQWLSQYTCPVAILTPVRPVAVSLYTPSGNINTVLEIINSYAQWLSQYTCSVAILT